jgi:1,4-alpha-glucan branching enzyme
MAEPVQSRAGPIHPRNAGKHVQDLRSQPPSGAAALIAGDPYLSPFEPIIDARLKAFESTRASFEGGLTGPISQGHHYFGFNRGERNGAQGVWYREWAPGAYGLSLVGDFNGWDRAMNPMERDEWGVWHTFLPDSEYERRLTHGSLVKVHVRAANGDLDRIPAYARRVVQDPETHHFTAQYWNPPAPHEWRHDRPERRGGLRIYEAHVGMAQEEGRVGSFAEFTERILPRIVSLGYNAIQLMAVMEHPYYGSFGYHVANFYAVSSRFGTPEDLKALIDRAHSLGLLVVMDLVHSHAVKNVYEGLAEFDGTDHQYFHAGARGEHPAWDSLLFDYAKYEVQRFLLSNARFWLEEFRFDGFRFDGVTSMLYHDHGLGAGFSSYEDYFGGNVDPDALKYLMLANDLVHTLRPGAITIAEDVSGMPGIARPVSQGGVGFDYRLSMGVPDYWIKTLKERTDEQWNISELYHMLLNRRHDEKHIAYAESHDQALVGDKTLAFRLMDQEMYYHMGRGDRNLVIDRGIALHKLIRLMTCSLAGEGYLNFMGNEFGHPEWIDFPREGNGFSYHYARRQWSLVDREDLRYRGLNAFDAAMLRLDAEYRILEDPLIEQMLFHEGDKVLAYRHGPLVFVFNFDPTRSFPDYRIPVPDPEDYRLLLNTDWREFEGQELVGHDMIYPKQGFGMYGRQQSIQLYIPSRTAQVLVPVGCQPRTD